MNEPKKELTSQEEGQLAKERTRKMWDQRTARWDQWKKDNPEKAAALKARKAAERKSWGKR